MKTLFLTLYIRCIACMCLSSAPLQADGIAIVFEGRGVITNAPAYEYIHFRPGEGSFNLILRNGNKVSGLNKHLIARYDYRTPPSQKVLGTLQSLSSKYVNAVPYLAPRIARMNEELRKAEFEVDISKLADKPTTVLIPEMTVKGKNYKNVRASSMRDGKLQFMHDDGVFSLPALLLPQSFLTKVAQSSPVIAETLDFRDLMDTYVSSVSISGKNVNGARILKKEEGNLVVDSDNGFHTIDDSALTPTDLVKLEAAEKRLTNLSRKFKRAQERQEKAQDEYFAQVEQKKIARYRMEQKAGETVGILIEPGAARVIAD